MKKYFYGFGTVIVLMILAGIIFIFSGLYNIAADVPHWKITYAMLDEARDSSVSHHSRDMNVTLPQDQSSIDTGFKHYHEMCRLCHGGPGFKRTEFAEGLYPSPPSLKSLQMQEEIGRAGILWVVTHGLKMTGMPSFDKTHTEKQIRDIVAFVEKLPDMTPEKYMEKFSAEKKANSEMPDHSHEEGNMSEQGDEDTL